MNSYYNLRSNSKEKELEIKFNSQEDLRKQEKSVYASLSKILFGVQQLYFDLSSSCVDEDCINNAVRRFDASVTKSHEEISNNLLYMSSLVIDDIYRFYNKLSDLKISLKDFNSSRNFEMANVSSYTYSSELADIVIDLQDRLLKKRSDLAIEFDRTKQEMMKYCCGRKPLQELLESYYQFKEQRHLISSLIQPLEVDVILSKKP